MLDSRRPVAAARLDSPERVVRGRRRQQRQAVLEIGSRRIGLAELVLRDAALQEVIKEIGVPADRAVVVGHGHVVLLVEESHIAA